MPEGEVGVGRTAARSALATAGGAAALVVGFARWFFLGRIDAPGGHVGGGLLTYGLGGLRARRSVQAWLVVRAGALAALVVSVGWAWVHPLAAAAMAVALLGASFAYFAVRERARARLLAQAARPVEGGVALRALGPTAVIPAHGPSPWPSVTPMASLDALREAIDALRAGELGRALGALDHVDPPHLRPDELRLADAVRAWAALLAGDRRGAAARAVGAVPTGLGGIDRLLVPVCLENALRDPHRLERMLDAWDTGHGAWEADAELRDWREVVRLKLGRASAEEVQVEDRARLAERCRVLGERELGAALEEARRPELGPGYR